MYVLEISYMNDTLALLDCLDWGVAVTDVAGVIRMWNRAAVDLTGIAADAACNDSIYRHFPELDRYKVSAHLKRSRTAMAVALRWRRPPPDEGASESAPLMALHLSLKPLAPEAHSPADCLWVWGFRAQPLSLEEAHADFIATVSHEFRTPLTSIKGFVDTLLDCHDRLKPQQQRHFLAIAKSQIERLIGMVEDVLLVSHMQAGPLQHRALQYLSLSETFRRVQTDFSPRQQARLHVSIEADLPPVWADPERLDRILRHLLDNALKYSADADSVAISACCHSLRPDWVQIEIADRGIGIAPERLPQIFTQFRQGSSPLTRDRDGTGLGLYIAKSLAESLGGALELESTLGEGTTCTIQLPTAAGLRWETPDLNPVNAPAFTRARASR